MTTPVRWAKYIEIVLLVFGIGLLTLGSLHCLALGRAFLFGGREGALGYMADQIVAITPSEGPGYPLIGKRDIVRDFVLILGQDLVYGAILVAGAWQVRRRLRRGKA